MQHRVDASREQAAGVAAQVTADEDGAGRDGVGVPGGQVVEHDDLVAGLDQLGSDNAADIPGAPGDEQLHAPGSTTCAWAWPRRAARFCRPRIRAAATA